MTKYLLTLSVILVISLLSSCGFQNYDSPSVSASNGIIPTGYQSSGPVITPGVFGASSGGAASGPSALAAERAAKSKEWNTMPR